MMRSVDPRRWRRALPVGVALSVLTAALAGCSTTSPSEVNVADYDHHRRHPIHISNEPEVLDIPVGMNGPAMSPQIESAIRNYVDGYEENGTGFITIQTPKSSANEFAAASTGQAVHYALLRSGVPEANIRISPYYVGDHAKMASLRVSYLRVKAAVPTCGVWPEKHPNRADNAQLYNLGCANQQNLAAMVANPADLIAPQPTGPANGERRAEVIRTYAKTGNTGWQPSPETRLLNDGIEGF